MKVLLVAEGSGGHLIPALQVARALAIGGAHTKVWYAQRPQTAPLADALTKDTAQASVEVDAIPIERSSNPFDRLWRCGALWQRASRCFETFSPDVVVGFGGWVCAPVVLAARARGISCMVHEQNVVMGRTNRLLARWVDRVAVSFRETQGTVRGAPSIMTGLPVRPAIGSATRAQAAARFGLEAERPTLLVLGGSQGSRALNRLMVQAAGFLTAEERRTWQIVHIAGTADAATVRAAYEHAQLRAWVGAFLVEMEAAYAHADLVIARAGASTIAELSRAGLPAVLIPYPHAGGHQRANARAVEAIGGGIVLEESVTTPARLLSSLRRILNDERLRTMMRRQLQGLTSGDAATRLTEAILEVGSAHEAARAKGNACQA